MPSVSNNNSVNSASPGPQEQGSSPVDPNNTTGKTGSHKVGAVNPNDVKPLIPTSESGKAATNELSNNVQPAEAKSVLGAKDTDSAVQSPETQLNAILSDGDLAKCYKSQAKDLYFNASEHALTDLQSFMNDFDFNCDPGKMAKAFKGAIKGVRSSLKTYKRDVSDLKVTVTTRDGDPVQLIPFKLKEISPEDLKELLDIALVLTKDAMKQRLSDPEYVPEEKYEGKISNCMDKIGTLLPQVNAQAKETFKSSFKLLEFPMIEIHFDASDPRSVEKVNAKNRSPVSMEQNKLEVANTREFYDDSVGVDDSGGHQKTSDPEELRRQKNIVKAKATRKEHLISETSEYTEKTAAKEGEIAEGVNKAITGKPYSSLGGGGKKIKEASDSKESPSPKAGQDTSTQAADGSVDDGFSGMKVGDSSEQWMEIQEATDDVLVPGWLEETASSTDLMDDLRGLETVQYDISLKSMNDEQLAVYQKYSLWDCLSSQELVALSLSKSSLISAVSEDIMKQAHLERGQTLMDDMDIPLPSLGELIERKKARTLRNTPLRAPLDGSNSGGKPPEAPSNEDFKKWLLKKHPEQVGKKEKEEPLKNSKPDSQSVIVVDNSQDNPTDTSLLDMSGKQQLHFRKNKLCQYMTPDQVVKLFKVRRGLVTLEDYNKVKDKANVNSEDDAEMGKIQLPTLETLLRAREKAESKVRPKNGKPDSQPVSGDEQPEGSSRDTSLLDMNSKQKAVFKKKKLWEYLKPNQIVKLFRSTVRLISLKIFQKADSIATVKDDAINKVTLPTLEELEAEHTKYKAPANIVAGAEGSEDDELKNPVTDISLTELNSVQRDFFKAEKLWSYMTADQIVKLYAELNGLIPEDVYEGVKDQVGMDLVEASKADIKLPTYEVLVEAMHKKMPLPPA